MGTKLCAICVDREAAVLWEDDGKTFEICRACAFEYAREGHGIERSYEGGGPSITTAEMSAGARKAMGDATYEKMMADAQNTSGVVGTAKSKEDVDWEVFKREGRRLNRASSLRSTHHARRMSQYPSRREKIGRIK